MFGRGRRCAVLSHATTTQRKPPLKRQQTITEANFFSESQKTKRGSPVVLCQALACFAIYPLKSLSLSRSFGRDFISFFQSPPLWSPRDVSSYIQGGATGTCEGGRLAADAGRGAGDCRRVAGEGGPLGAGGDGWRWEGGGRPLRGAGPRAREASGGWRLARGMRLSVGGFVAACG